MSDLGHYPSGNRRTGDHNDSGRSGCGWIAGLIILALAALAIAYLLHIHI